MKDYNDDVLSRVLVQIEPELARELLCYIGDKLVVISKYKDIEREFGIKLITIFDALKNGIFFRRVYSEGENIEFRKVRGIELNGLSIIDKVCDHPECDDIVYFENYGKNWALTKEELEG